MRNPESDWESISDVVVASPVADEVGTLVPFGRFHRHRRDANIKSWVALGLSAHRRSTSDFSGRSLALSVTIGR